MGTNVSKTSVDIINETVINTILSVSQECNNYINSNQKLVVGGTNLFGKYTQSVKLNSTCIQNVKLSADLFSKMANDIKHQAEQSGIALLPSINADVNDTIIKNLLKINITNSFLQKCATTLDNNQDLAIEPGFNLFTRASQDVEAVTKCMSDTLNQNNFAQSMIVNTDQKVTQHNANPLQVLADIMNNLTFGVIAMIFMFIGIIILIIYGITRLFT